MHLLGTKKIIINNYNLILEMFVNISTGNFVWLQFCYSETTCKKQDNVVLTLSLKGI